ncbi:hypothetical protein [Aestuariivirga sp.]|uniref:hypothetical protein n=1 Tax=Aestuariivirga sp. TaxID=2650926 RepID=UPI0039E3853F
MTASDHSADAVRQFAQRILATGYTDLPARERRVIERMAKCQGRQICTFPNQFA